MPKDCEQGLGTVGDVFFLFLQKILDWEALLETLRDLLLKLMSNSIFASFKKKIIFAKAHMIRTIL